MDGLRYFSAVATGSAGSGRRRATRLALLTAVLSFPASSAWGQTNVRFAADIPAPPAQMRRFKLTPTAAPQELVNGLLKARGLPGLQTEGRVAVARGGQSDIADDTVRAVADLTTGDLHVRPNLMELARASTSGTGLDPARASGLASRLLADARFIPKDATETRPAPPIGILGGATPQAADRTAPGGGRIDARTVMTIVPAFRYVDGFKVYGTGSRAVVSVAGDGSVVGLLRRWRTAAGAEVVRPTVTQAAVRDLILRQLRPQAAAPGARVTVDKVVVAYYDANAGYLQPVYRFEADVRGGGRQPTRIRTAGYVPIVSPLEPIPDLSAKPAGDAPTAPAPQTAMARSAAGTDTAGATAGATAIITLGEYANRDWPNDGGYVSMSNAFYAGLTFGKIFGWNRPFVRTQWYEAHPFELIGASSRSYMNAVNIAYTVPHGNWLVNTTLRNDSDFWTIPQIGTNGAPGFGAAAGGKLAHWIIMSCEVIPSMYDRQNEAGGSGNPYTAFDAWWPVFQGLHTAIGFRTVMFYPDNALQSGFAIDAAFGGDLNAAWFQEVAAHDGDDGTYANDHLKGSPLVHYDRASTMIDARNLGQSIYNVAPQSKATTLWNFWMGN